MPEPMRARRRRYRLRIRWMRFETPRWSRRGLGLVVWPYLLGRRRRT